MSRTEVTGGGNSGNQFGDPSRINLLDWYPNFLPIPATARNTFVGATIDSTRSNLSIKTAGAIVEANKICELTIDDDKYAFGTGTPGFRGPGATNIGDFKTELACQFWCDAVTRANTAVDAYAGVEIFSATNNSLNGNGAVADGSVKLFGYFNDYTKFGMSVRRGTGTATTFTTATVPNVAVAPNPEIASGHLLRMLWDPFALTIDCYVDTTHIGKADMSTMSPGMPPSIGFFLWSGNNAVAVSMQASISMMRVTKFDTNKIGSGFI